MSTKAQSWVWDHSPTNGNDRLVLLFLADQGDDDGTNSFPSIRRIAEKCRVNVDTVSRVLIRLEEVGEVLIERPDVQGRGHFNRYTLVLGRPIDEVEDARRKARDLRPFGEARKRSGKVAKSSGTRGHSPRLPIDPQTPDGVVSPPTREPLLNDSARGETPPKRRTQIPVDWTPTDVAIAWARKNVPSIDPVSETVSFFDYWKAKGTPMADWEATWRNWIRRAAVYQRGRNGNGRNGGAEAVMAELRREYQG